MGTGHARECQALVIIGVRGSMMLASAVCIVLQSDFAVNKAKLPSTPWLVESRAIFSTISRKIVLTARPCSASLMLVLFNVMAVKGREAFHLADPVCHYNAECMKQWQVPGCPCNQEMGGEAMPRCIVETQWNAPRKICCSFRRFAIFLEVCLCVTKVLLVVPNAVQNCLKDFGPEVLGVRCTCNDHCIKNKL